MIYLTDTISSQAATFLLSVGAGVLLGLVYDLFKLLRMVLPPKPLLIFLQDVLFSVLAAFFTYLFILGFHAGELRGFIFVGEGCGFLVHHLLLSDFVVAGVTFLSRVLSRVVNTLFQLIFIPLWFVFRVLTFPFLQIYRLLRKLLKNFWKFFKIILRRGKTLLYNQFISKKKVIRSEEEDHEFQRLWNQSP